MRVRRSVLAVFVVSCILGSATLYERLRLVASEPDELVLQNVTAIWYEAARAKDIHMMADLYSRTARVRPITPPGSVRNANVWRAWSDLLSNPGFTLVIGRNPTEINVSDDMRYYVTSYEASLRDAEGKGIAWQGEHIMLWKRQANGQWKASVDVFSVPL